MECGHETATSHLLLGGPAIRNLGSLAGRRADEFDRNADLTGSPRRSFSVISPTGGIRPADRHRANRRSAILNERSYLVASMRRSLRSRSRVHLGRSPSTISREVQRNGGADRYRLRGPISPRGIGRGAQALQRLRVFLRRQYQPCWQRQWSPEQIALEGTSQDGSAGREITEKTDEDSRSNRRSDRTHRLAGLPAIPDFGSLGRRVIMRRRCFMSHIHLCKRLECCADQLSPPSKSGLRAVSSVPMAPSDS